MSLVLERDKEFIEQNNRADEILRRRDEEMKAKYGEEGWRKKQEEYSKKAQALFKSMEKPEQITPSRIKRRPLDNTNRYAETENAEEMQMTASKEEINQDRVITEEPEKDDVAVDEVITPGVETEKGELKPVEYKGNYLGGKKAIKDKIFNRSRGSKSLQNATTLLFYLIQHSAWKGKNDKHKTYKNWYAKKNLIVASRSQEQMAVDLGVSVRTIQRWLDELEKDRLIKRDIEGRENVYILGRVMGDTEFFFYER